MSVNRGQLRTMRLLYFAAARCSAARGLSPIASELSTDAHLQSVSGYARARSPAEAARPPPSARAEGSPRRYPSGSSCDGRMAGMLWEAISARGMVYVGGRQMSKAAAEIVGGHCPIHHTELEPAGYTIVGAGESGHCAVCSTTWFYARPFGLWTPISGSLDVGLFRDRAWPTTPTAPRAAAYPGALSTAQIAVAIELIRRIAEIIEKLETAGETEATVEAVVERLWKLLESAVQIGFGRLHRIHPASTP